MKETNVGSNLAIDILAFIFELLFIRIGLFVALIGFGIGGYKLGVFIGVGYFSLFFIPVVALIGVVLYGMIILMIMVLFPRFRKAVEIFMEEREVGADYNEPPPL
jgi:hypothetical protein